MTKKQIKLSIKIKLSQAKKAGLKITLTDIANRIATQTDRTHSKQYVNNVLTHTQRYTIERLLDINTAVDSIISDLQQSVNSIKITN